MSALGVPLALLLGLVAELGGTLVLHFTGRARPWFRPARDLWRDLRRLVRRRDRASALELVGTATALTGAGLAAAAAMGSLPGGLALVYPALVLAVVGGHVATSLAPGAPDAAVRARRDALLAEPAFVLALGAGLLRWNAFDLEAVRGAQQVLGPGIAVGPPAVTAGLVIAVVVVLVAGGYRLPPLRQGRGTLRRPAGSAVAAALCRWAAAGATAMVAAVLVAGGSSLAPGAVEPVAVVWWAVAAVGAALVLGAVRAALALLPAR
ncbi:MAG TPA: hypothetical protein VGR49_00305, partial [Actinomycetota bacterium]|nr:hypothetical protein [Actinomycetota bacterium]